MTATLSEYDRMVARRMSEKTLQERVIRSARARNFLVYHPYDSRRSTPGFPDLVILWNGSGPMPERPIIVAELKTERGSLRPEQKAWRAAFEAVAALPGSPLAYHLWRPRDWLDRTIIRALGGE